MQQLSNPKSGKMGRKKNRDRRLANTKRLKGQTPFAERKDKGNGV